MKIKIGVFFGGNSVEHDVSIITAVQAMENINKDKYEVIPVYIDKERNFYTGHILKDIETFKDFKSMKKYLKKVTLVKDGDEFALVAYKSLFKSTVAVIDVAFPIVHGKGVEDGSLAGYFDSIGIPYVGPKVLGAALGQDKVVQKQVMKAEGVNVVDYIWFYDDEYLADEKEILKKIKKLGYPVIVKPARLGSSIGINYVADESKIESAIEEAITYDEKIIVEACVSNLLEVDCAVFGNHSYMETSLIGEMLTSNKFLTFEDKYLAEGGKKGPSKSLKSGNATETAGFKIPAKLDKEIENKIYEESKKAFRALELSGVTRFDFLVNKKTKEVYVNEPNTIPGCLAFFFFTPKDISYEKLLDDMITITIKAYKEGLKKISSFDSNVLSTYGGAKGSKTKLK